MSTLYEWFARSVRQQPDAVALEVAGRSLTYVELSRCAAAIAARMVDRYADALRSLRAIWLDA